ncbi:uncharacterized protein LOC118405944 [Branchiostoma floridae]|uniref:Uncharacterized protein LOC118405944 n=1 Tax=Branchiostoma floridae TaxID=7739 RepID=A0A9J7HLC7_BRAFL|nr:uncharacterized protein LOC118405944 [Branchiostoma floridae]
MAGETAPPGGQDCYVTADIHEGLRSIAEPLQVHRSGNIHLHGDVSVVCNDEYELQVLWTVRGSNQTTPEEVMDEMLPTDAPINDVHLTIPPKTLPLGVHMVQFQVLMKVTGRGHVSVSAAQTWVDFVRVPVVYSLGSSLRTVQIDGEVVVRADSSFDPEGLLPASGFTYDWTCRLTHLPANSACGQCATGTYVQDPSWVVSSSGTPWIWGGVTYDAGKVLDGNSGTYWNPQGTGRYSNNRNIVLDLRLPYCLTQVALNNFGDVVHDISAFTLQKSQVGSPYNWEDVVSVTNVQAGTNQRQEFDRFQGEARYWRFVVTQTPYGWQPYFRELDLFGVPDPSHLENSNIPQGLNIAEGRTASTNYPLAGYGPEKIVDGNTNTNHYHGSCMHSQGDKPNVWVHIDLCQPFSINSVVIHNRMDFGPERANPFNLHLGNSSDILLNPTLGGDLNFDLSQTPKTILVNGLTARYVGILLPGLTRTLQLCEVQVFVNNRDISPQESCFLLGCPQIDSHPGVLVFESPLDSTLTDLIPSFPRPAGLVADVSVEITAGDLPPVTLHTVIHVAPDNALSGLDIHCEENCDPWKTLSTQPLSLYTDSEILGTSEFSLVEFPADFPGQQWTSGIDIITTDRLRVLAGTFWVDYTPLFDLAVGTILLFVRGHSVDGRFFEFELAPIEISPPTVSQLQSYLDNFYIHPNGLFFRQLSLEDSETAFKNAILASAAAGHLAYTGHDVLELVDMITTGLSMVVELEDVESINGMSLSLLLSTVVPDMVSGQSQVLAAASLRAAFERTKELAGNTTAGVTPLNVVNTLAGFMFSATVNVMTASSHWAEMDHHAGKFFSPNLVYSQEATTVSFQALDIMDDIYLNKLMPEFSDPEIFADISMSKVHVRIKRENRTRFSERVYHVRGDSDCLVRVPSFPDLLGDSCIDNDVVGIQFLESNFNPYEYSNNSKEVQADVTGLGVKCGNRTVPISGLTDPIDILTRRQNDSLAESIYVFEGSEPLDNMAVFRFFVRSNHSALSLILDFNSTVLPQNVSMFLRKEAPPTPSDYNWTTALPVSEEGIVSIPWINGTNLTSNPYHWLLSPEDIGITDADVENMTNYFVGVRIGSEQELGRGDIVNFTLYVFETSCVYFNEDLHLWQSDGCEVGLMSNTSHIHCRCDHLTKFSGFVKPNPLNIAEALSANILENPAGLVLVLTLFGMYLMGIVWARKSDRRDLVKAGIGILPGHRLNPRKDCQYVITVYTGFKANAGTTAQVTVVLYSQDHGSPPFTLSDEKRILFERGSVDSFLVSTSEPLGALRFLRVWHNNGGYSPEW